MIVTVEDVPLAKCIDANKQPCAPEQSANLAHWNSIVAEFGLEGRATLLFEGQSPWLKETVAFARDADFFINISGHFRQRSATARKAKVRASILFPRRF